VYVLDTEVVEGASFLLSVARDRRCNIGHVRCRDIGELKELQFLNVQKNKLSQLPDTLCYLTKLYRLGAKSNRLIELPQNIGELTGLVELFVTDNQLTELPDSICQCSKLVKLQVRVQGA
jgi:Leucine-rich repeat (LRR) protein